MNIQLADGVRKGIALACALGGPFGLGFMCVSHNTDFAILFSTVTVCGMVGVVGEYIVASLNKG